MADNEAVALKLLKELTTLKATSVAENQRIAQILNGIFTYDTSANIGFRKVLMESVGETANDYLLKNESLTPAQRKANELRDGLLDDASDFLF